MGDTGDLYNALREERRERRRLHGIPCPACTKREPKRSPTILLPQQRCYCGYRDTRPRTEDPFHV